MLTVVLYIEVSFYLKLANLLSPERHAPAHLARNNALSHRKIPVWHSFRNKCRRCIHTAHKAFLWATINCLLFPTWTLRHTASNKASIGKAFFRFAYVHMSLLFYTLCFWGFAWKTREILGDLFTHINELVTKSSLRVFDILT